VVATVGFGSVAVTGVVAREEEEEPLPLEPLEEEEETSMMGTSRVRSSSPGAEALIRQDGPARGSNKAAVARRCKGSESG